MKKTINEIWLNQRPLRESLGNQTTGQEDEIEFDEKEPFL